MDILFSLLAILGAWVVIVAIVVGAAWAWGAFWDWWESPCRESFNMGCNHVRQKLMNDSWWFSESPETMQLLQDLACEIRVDEAREAWRRARAARQKPSADDHLIGTLDSSDTWEQPQ